MLDNFRDRHVVEAAQMEEAAATAALGLVGRRRGRRGVIRGGEEESLLAFLTMSGGLGHDISK
jgi:hypothetical protein